LGGGPIGALVALVAVHRGAGSVVVSEPNDARRALLTGLGIRTVRPDELAELVAERTDGEGADLTFDVTGHPSAIAVAPEITRVRGTILVGGLFHTPPEVPLQLVTLREQTLVGARVYTSAHMDEAIALLATGAVPATALITHEVALADAERDAYHMLDQDRSAMKVLLRIHP
ncbi:MAG: zinc-binding dehydrogenase, partial [Pseudonocardia sp.]